MSRVYEALKRADDQQSAQNHESVPNLQTEETAKRTSGSITPIISPHRFEGTLPPAESALPVLESSALASAANVRGPALVVGRSEPQYRRVVEQFHLFAVGLQNWAADNDKRIFMLTSALSGEGKSFMAVNLAASLARLGNRVVLVDADLRSPTLHRSFNLAPMGGLVSYLAEEIQLQQCLHATQIPRLMLVPAGGTSYTPTEALARPRMREFMRELRNVEPHHYVIVDAPAAAAVPEAQILNRLIDALVVVVAANRTPRELVKRTIEKAAGTQIYGIALNRFDPPHSATTVYYPEKYSRQSQEEPRSRSLWPTKS